MEKLTLSISNKNSEYIEFTKWGADIYKKSFIKKELDVENWTVNSLLIWTLEQVQEYFNSMLSGIVAEDMSNEKNLYIIKSKDGKNVYMGRNETLKSIENDPNFNFENVGRLVSQRVMRVLDQGDYKENRAILCDMLFNPNDYHPSLENKDDYLK